MKAVRQFLIPAAVLVTLFLVTAPVWAADAAEPDPADSTAGVIFRWLNFAIVFGGIAYFLANAGSFFKDNAKSIAADITDAQSVKAAADRELSDVNTKVSHLDQEVKDLRESARRDMAAEAERLRASGAAEIEKIKQAAAVELAASERAATQELREIAASKAVERAGEMIRSKMNGDLRAKMFQSFLAELGRSKN